MAGGGETSYSVFWIWASMYSILFKKFTFVHWIHKFRQQLGHGNCWIRICSLSIWFLSKGLDYSTTKILSIGRFEIILVITFSEMRWRSSLSSIIFDCFCHLVFLKYFNQRIYKSLPIFKTIYNFIAYFYIVFTKTFVGKR